MIKNALALGLLTAITLAAAALFSLTGDTNSANAGNGGMEAMSIDLDTTGNTPTSLGDLDSCIEVSAGDTFDLDVTALNIPATNPMITYNFNLLYDSDVFSVTAADHAFLITTNAASTLPPLAAGDTPPDSDGKFEVGTVDISGPDGADSGSGVLSRITLAVDAAAPDGGYDLDLFEPAHIDDGNIPWAPNTVNAAQVAVGISCEDIPPPAEFAFGDIDCDGDVDAVDALQVLRHVAGLGANQQQGCSPVGVAAVQPAGLTPFGDIDCDGDVDAVDALQILRHVAGLGANQQQGCPPVGV